MTDGEYMHSGPWYPGESWHEAMGRNTAASLSAHMIRRASGGMNRPLRPGHGFEHEPVDDAERAAQHVTQSTAASIRRSLRPGSNTHEAVRQAVREGGVSHDPYEHAEQAPRRGYGSNATPRAPQSPWNRRGPGGRSRP